MRNRLGRTVVIPTRVVNGSLEYFYGGPLPKLRDGTVFDMIVPEWAIEDKSFLPMLQRHHYDVLLRDSSVVYCAVALDQVPEPLKKSTLTLESLVKGKVSARVPSMFPGKGFVPINLMERLELELRGTKLGRLKSAKCIIPALGQEAHSLNHAYRLISESFEPVRISHSGNVFNEMLYVDGKGQCFRLGELRDTLQSCYEGDLRPMIREQDTLTDGA
jgi:hypothetical protein